MIQGKEPEYTKVRRKGNRLRDPHSESQGKNPDNTPVGKSPAV